MGTRRPHPARLEEGQLLGNGRNRALRTVLGNPHRPPRRRRPGRHIRRLPGQRRPPASSRNLEPRLHAIQPHGRRLARAPTEQAHRHGDGLRAPGDGHARQTIQLRHRRVPAVARPRSRTQRQDLRPNRRQTRRGLPRHLRPHPCGGLQHRGRPAPFQHRRGLCHSPHPPPRHPVRLLILGFERTLHARPRSDPRRSNGRCIP